MTFFRPYYATDQVTDYPPTKVDRVSELRQGASDCNTVSYTTALYNTPLGIVCVQKVLPHPRRHKVAEYEFSFAWNGYLYHRTVEDFPTLVPDQNLAHAADCFAREVAADNGAEIMAKIHARKSTKATLAHYQGELEKAEKEAETDNG